jgi:BirA family biotin operon repressor/biotin-[acetyl-CoA-carboxylase] ligase
MDSIGLLSLGWGLAVAETVDTATGSRSQVKWPNDVLVNGRKIAGILVTNGVQPGTGAYRQVTGIGLNCSTQEPDLPSTATSLAIQTGQAPHFDLVLRELFRRLESVYATLESGDERSVLDRLGQRLAFMDEMVLVRDGDRTHSGIVRGVDHQAALLVEDASGTIQPIVAGDLTRGPSRSA